MLATSIRSFFLSLQKSNYWQHLPFFYAGADIQCWPALATVEPRPLSFTINILIIAGITMKSTRAYYPWEGDPCTQELFSLPHFSMHSVEEHCKPVQTHTMCVILHSSQRLSHPQSTRLHASATEPEKSCTYLVSSLEPFPSVCRLCTSEKGRLVGREGVHCAHCTPPRVYPGCTQAPLLG